MSLGILLSFLAGVAVGALIAHIALAARFAWLGELLDALGEGDGAPPSP